MRKLISVVSVSVVMGGCFPIGGGITTGDAVVPAPLGHSAILPTGNIEVGNLYFSGEGREPRFATRDGRIFNHLCYEDFDRTAALRNIGTHVVDRGVRIANQSVNGSISGDGEASTSELKKLAKLSIGAGAGRERTAKAVNVRELRLTAEGQQIVRDSIEDKCVGEIRKLKGLGRQVIIVTGAYRADKVTVTTKDEAKGNANVGVTPFGGVLDIGGSGSYNSSRTTEYPNVFITVAPLDF